MTSNEIKKIIDGLDVLKEINVYYNIEEITNPMHAYIKTYWQKNKDKYIGRSLIAILVSKKLLANDPMYFLDEGVVIGGYYISYNELNWVGKFSLFHGEKIENDYMICYGNEKTLRILAEHKTRTFACNVIEKIIEKDNLLHNNGDKIKYYLNLYVRIEGSQEGKVLKAVLYKKIIQLTQDPMWIQKLVEEFGYLEYVFKYQESEKKRNKEADKTLPLNVLKGMTVVMLKNACNSMDDQYRKMQENILSDCLPYLKLMQNCNQLQGYSQFVYIYYDMLIFASEINKRISDNLIYEFNLTIDEFRDKIEKNIIELPQNDNFSLLSVIKDISNIYSGKIVNALKKECKYTFLKNADKAFYWLNLYTKQAGCDNTIEYEDVMFSLADIYKYGIDTIPADEYKMLECLKTAANHGSVKASKFLAEYYVNGSEEKDKWVQLARENGQRFKDKRSINEKMKDKVGLDITETADVVGTVAGIGRDVAGVFNSVRDIVGTVGGIATDYVNATAERKTVVRNIEREQLEHEQYIEGQRAKNMKAKAENMKTERKAKKDIAREERKNR